MKPTKRIRCSLILLIMVSFMIISSIGTTLLYHHYFKKYTLPIILSSLNHKITQIDNFLDTTSANLNYTVALLLQHPSVITLDSEFLPSLLGEFLFYSSQVSNAYIININKEIVAGIDNNALLHIKERNHIDTALSGSISSYASFINTTPFLQTAFPIYANEQCIGSLILTYDFSSITHNFLTLQSHFSGTQFYLFDESGKLLLTSEALDSKKFIPTMDILKLRSTIDYAPDKPFSFFSATSCYGRYLYMPDSNWTLLLTSPPPTLPSYLFFIFFSWYLFISLIFLIVTLLFKKTFCKSAYSDHKAAIHWT